MLIDRCLCGRPPFALEPGFKEGQIAVCSCGTKWLQTHQSAEDIDAYYRSGAYHSDHARHVDVVDYADRYQTDRTAAVKRIHRYREILPDHVPNDSTIRPALLDVGAANGAFVDVANEYGYAAIGIEPDRRWKRRWIFCGTLETLVTPRTFFDWLTYHDVLEHVPRPLVELERAVARLAPNGVLIVEVPDVHVPEGTKHYKREHLWYFTLRTLADLMTAAGVEVTAFDFPIPGKMTVFGWQRP